MAIIISRPKRGGRRQPPRPILNEDSQQATQLLAWYPLQNDYRDHSGNGYHLEPEGAGANVGRFESRSSEGFSAKSLYNGSTSAGPELESIDTDLSSVLPTYGNFTIMAWCAPDSAHTGAVLALGNNGGANNNHTVEWYYTTSNVFRSFIRDTAATTKVISDNQLDKWVHIALVGNSTTTIRCYQNGELYTTTTHARAPNAFQQIFLATNSQNSADFNGHIFDARVYRQSITPERIAQIYDARTRFDLWYELGRIFYSFPAAAADITRSPTSGSLTLTGASASLALHIRTTPSSQDITVTGQSTSVAQKLVTSPSVQSITVTGQSVTPKLQIKLAPSVANVTVTGQSATVAQHIRKTPTSQDITVTGQTATAAVSGEDVAASPTVQSITVTGQSATVAEHKRRTATVVSITTTGQSATVSHTNSTQKTPTQVNLQITGASAQVVQHLRRTVTQGNVTVTGQSSSLQVTGGSVAATPTVGIGTITGVRPTVTVTGGRGGASMTLKQMRKLERQQLRRLHQIRRDDDEIVAILGALLRRTK